MHPCLAPFLANGRRTAAHFRECWERSVARAGAIPHDGTAPSANPLEWPIEMAGLGAGPEFQLMVQTQRALTLACEAHEWAALDKNCRELPENPRLIQFHINHNSNVFRVHARSFARFHCFSRPCASFRTSSILIAPIRPLPARVQRAAHGRLRM